MGGPGSGPQTGRAGRASKMVSRLRAESKESHSKGRLIGRYKTTDGGVINMHSKAGFGIDTKTRFNKPTKKTSFRLGK